MAGNDKVQQVIHISADPSEFLRKAKTIDEAMLQWEKRAARVARAMSGPHADVSVTGNYTGSSESKFLREGDLLTMKYTLPSRSKQAVQRARNAAQAEARLPLNERLANLESMSTYGAYTPDQRTAMREKAAALVQANYLKTGARGFARMRASIEMAPGMSQAEKGELLGSLGKLREDYKSAAALPTEERMNKEERVNAEMRLMAAKVASTNIKEEKGILDRYITRGGILRGATGLISGIANLQQVAMANPGQPGAVTLAGREMVGSVGQSLGTAAVMADGGPLAWGVAIGSAILSAVTGIDKVKYQRGTENQQRAMALQSNFSTSFGMWNPNKPAGSTAMQNFGELRAENYKRSLPFDKQGTLEDMLRPGADLSKYSSHAKQRYSKYLGLQMSTSPDVATQNTFMYLRDQMARGPYGMLEGEFAQAYGQAASGFGMTQDYMPRGKTRRNMRETWYQSAVADPSRTGTILRGMEMARGTGMDTDALFSLLGSGTRMGGGGLDEISGVIGAMQRAGMSMPAIGQMGGSLAQQVLAAEKMGIRTDYAGMASTMGGLAASGIRGPRLGNLGEGFMDAQQANVRRFGGYKEGLLETAMGAWAAQNAPPGTDVDMFLKNASQKDIPRILGMLPPDLQKKALQGQGLEGNEGLSQLFKHTEADTPWWRQTPEAELQAAMLRSSGVGMDVVQNLAAAATSLNSAAALLKQDYDGTKASAGLGK